MRLAPLRLREGTGPRWPLGRAEAPDGTSGTSSAGLAAVGYCHNGH